MKIMIIGGGGREHALAHYLNRSPEVDEIYVLPGNAGIAKEATTVDIAATDIEKIVAFALDNGIGFAVVAPDDPLVLGAVDALEAVGIPCFGPNADAAIIEGSKAFAKNMMKKYGIPTAGFTVFDSYPKAMKFLLTNDHYPIVIKADGLALGKGVIIAKDDEEARAAVDAMMKDRIFGKSGERIVFEQFLTGPEVSVLCFTDGETVVPMVSSMDHKRALDGDEGPNTGGMGAVAPNRHYTDDVAARCMAEIFLPTVNAMNKEGRKFKGCLYFGLMLTEDGPKVIEYNCRFGDPETQVVLPLLETDLFTVVKAVAEERLGEIEVKNSSRHACCVVVVSGGYPGSYEKGKPISFGESGDMDDVFVFHAGTAESGGNIVTAGGRVLGVTAVGDTRGEAIKRAYEAAKEIDFDGAYYRKDIGSF